MYMHTCTLYLFAVSVVRLLRIEQGGAYADVLGGDGEQSWEKEMDYVSRTLGFRTLPLDSRGQRQVWSSAHLTTLSIHTYTYIHTYTFTFTYVCRLHFNAQCIHLQEDL